MVCLSPPQPHVPLNYMCAVVTPIWLIHIGDNSDSMSVILWHISNKYFNCAHIFRGPVIGKLQNGETVALEDGRIVSLTPALMHIYFLLLCCVHMNAFPMKVFCIKELYILISNIGKWNFYKVIIQQMLALVSSSAIGQSNFLY